MDEQPLIEKPLVEKLVGHAHPALVISLGLGILAGLYGFPYALEPVAARIKLTESELTHSLEQATLAHERAASLAALKTQDLQQLKGGLSGNALSQKSLFETGLSLQEERRLLEKQLEIMTTSLLINPALQRIFMMRADQVLSSYLISYIPIKSFAGAPAELPATVRIVSKERFAHPERGKSEQVNGTLQWIPPQVGTSVRSKALGEFVVFTNSALILHGPSVDEEAHARFPHVCLGLDHEAARRLYRGSFIGTKIALNNVSIEKVELPTSAVLSTGAAPSSNPERP